MKIRYFLTLLPAILGLFLSGCGDKMEMDRQAHVVVLGVDLVEEHQLEITFQIANPQVGSSERGKAENEPPSTIVTLRAPDVIVARELANSSIPRKLTFGHLHAIIISEKLARSSAFHHVLSASTGDPELRREVNIYITKEKASEFIHANKSKIETRPHKYYEFLNEIWENNGYTPDSTVNHYFERLHGDIFLAVYATATREEVFNENEDNYIAGEVPQKGGNPVQAMGSAVVKNGRMIGTLTGEETRLALLLRQKELLHSLTASVSDPMDELHRISFRYLKNESTKVKIDVKQRPPSIDVMIPLKVQILSVPSQIDYVLNMENQKKLREHLQLSMEKSLNEIIKKMQQEFKGDPFQWHLEARSKFWTLQQFEQFDWEKQFTQANVKVNVDIEFESFGKQYKVPEISE